MQPTDRACPPDWNEIRDACGGLQQAMDAMIEQPDFASFRPGIARAIALARDGKQRADHPEPIAPVDTMTDAADRLEAIAVELTPTDVARIVLGAKA
ncbi:MAG: hypothetical protein JW839_18140 [Candidatus Lokiarchaeota archaeon]|nr:hypothetical protein [Candidatus Lokiarchaeota archaeon]